MVHLVPLVLLDSKVWKDPAGSPETLVLVDPQGLAENPVHLDLLDLRETLAAMANLARKDLLELRDHPEVLECQACPE